MKRAVSLVSVSRPPGAPRTWPRTIQRGSETAGAAAAFGLSALSASRCAPAESGASSERSIFALSGCVSGVSMPPDTVGGGSPWGQRNQPRPVASTRTRLPTTSLLATTIPPSVSAVPAPAAAPVASCGSVHFRNARLQTSRPPAALSMRRRRIACASSRRAFATRSVSPSRRALSARLCSSNQCASTSERKGSSSASTCSTRSRCRCARSTSSAAAGACSRAATALSRSVRRACERRSERTALRTAAESQARRFVRSCGGERSA